MRFDILNRWSGAVQFSAEIECDEDQTTSVKLGLAVKVALKSGANLSEADLSRANLSRANLSEADLSGASLSWADLCGADLSGANLSWANLSEADLSRANLSGADLSLADLSGANLSWANLSRADLSGAKNLAHVRWGSDQVTTIAPVFFTGSTWPVFITDRHIKIGCEVHTTDAWEAFTDREIAEMDGATAARFWAQWKDAVISLAKAHQSKIGGDK